ncbi:MAG: ribonuclease P protein component [Eubacteriales bacterium]|jgi:ribonuclease P protein component
MRCGFKVMDFLSIKENKDFCRIYAKGKSYVSPVVVTYVLKNRRKNVRAGITTTKKIGNAVKRNRARRVIREAFRILAPSIKPGYDFIFVARGKTPYVKSTEIVRVLSAQLKKAGVMK